MKASITLFIRQIFNGQRMNALENVPDSLFGRRMSSEILDLPRR